MAQNDEPPKGFNGSLKNLPPSRLHMGLQYFVPSGKLL